MGTGVQKFKNEQTSTCSWLFIGALFIIGTNFGKVCLFSYSSKNPFFIPGIGNL